MLKWGTLILRKISTTPPKRDRIRSTIDAVFGKYLFLTNTITSGGLMLVGDLIDQELHLDPKKNCNQRYDYERLARMCIVGLSMGPVHHYYYKYLNVIWPARDFKSISKKILADQFVMGPVCIAQFFYTLGLLERKSVAEMNEEIIQKFATVYLMDWCIWPPTQFVNFYFVPCKYQVVYINAVTTLYDVFLSYIKHES